MTKNDDRSELPRVDSVYHPKSRSAAKDRLFEETYLSNPALTVAEIGARCGISKATAFAWRARLREQLTEEPIVDSHSTR